VIVDRDGEIVNKRGCMLESTNEVLAQPTPAVIEEKNTTAVVQQTQPELNNFINEQSSQAKELTPQEVEPVKKEFTQRELNDIIIREKDKARKQGYEHARNDLISKISPVEQHNQTQQQYSQEFVSGYQAAQIEQQKKLESFAVTEFINRIKVEPGSKEAQETLNLFGEFDKTAMPLLFQLNSLGNTSEVLGYLKNNSNVKQEIKNLIQLDFVAATNGMQSTMSHDKLLEISERLRQNANAPNIKANNPKPPSATDLKPSTIALGEKNIPKVGDIIKNMHR
jgi:hypothetical protein